MFTLVERKTGCPCSSCVTKNHIKYIAFSHRLNDLIDYLYSFLSLRRGIAYDIQFVDSEFMDTTNLWHNYNPNKLIFSFADHRDQCANSHLQRTKKINKVIKIIGDVEVNIFYGSSVKVLDNV